MSSGPVFVDTWGWCALGHRADRQHRAALEFYRRLRQGSSPAFTSDYLLDEVITLRASTHRRCAFHAGRPRFFARSMRCLPAGSAL
jgi:predicted nucleic acid-binding protein